MKQNTNGRNPSHLPLQPIFVSINVDLRTCPEGSAHRNDCSDSWGMSCLMQSRTGREDCVCPLSQPPMCTASPFIQGIVFSVLTCPLAVFVCCSRDAIDRKKKKEAIIILMRIVLVNDSKCSCYYSLNSLLSSVGKNKHTEKLFGNHWLWLLGSISDVRSYHGTTRG